MRISAQKLTQFCLVALFGAAGVLAAWATNANKFEDRFQAAIAEQTFSAPPETVAARVSKVEVPQAGSEDFWLGETKFSGPKTQPVSLTGPVKIGDELVISSTSGSRQLVVIDVVKLNKPSESAYRARDKDLLLVTLQNKSAIGSVGGMLRIVIDSDNKSYLNSEISSIERAL